MPNAIITGATQGIGKAITEKLLANGFSVAICARTEKDLVDLSSAWTQQYPAATILALQADLGEKQQVFDFAGEILDAFGEINILVNNAGLFFPGRLADEPEGHLEKLMEVNMYSAYYLTRAILPAIKRDGSGHIFNNCSVASLKAYPNGGAYSISKYALLGFSENLRHELVNENIRVTAICAGATWTRSWESAGIDRSRMMEAEDVAEMVWATYNLSSKADVETIIMRPTTGDL